MIYIIIFGVTFGLMAIIALSRLSRINEDLQLEISYNDSEILELKKKLKKSKKETDDIYNDLNKIIDREITKNEELEQELIKQTRLKEKYWRQKQELKLKK